MSACPRDFRLQSWDPAIPPSSLPGLLTHFTILTLIVSCSSFQETTSKTSTGMRGDRWVWLQSIFLVMETIFPVTNNTQVWLPRPVRCWSRPWTDTIGELSHGSPSPQPLCTQIPHAWGRGLFLNELFPTEFRFVSEIYSSGLCKKSPIMMRVPPARHVYTP